MIDDLISFAEAHDPGGKMRYPVPDDVTSQAIYSPCQQYRYVLRRQWAPAQARHTIMFLMLNPSTATEDVDDPTVRKCRNYARQWGYNTLLVGNIMAFRATDPSLLRGIAEPVGPDNLAHLREMLSNKPRLVCAWGRVPKRFQYAEQAVIQLIRDVGATPYVLQLNSSGGPWHPLYLPLAIEEPLLWTPSC